MEQTVVDDWYLLIQIEPENCTNKSCRNISVYYEANDAKVGFRHGNNKVDNEFAFEVNQYYLITAHICRSNSVIKLCIATWDG